MKEKKPVMEETCAVRKETKTVWMSAFRRVVPADYENWLEEMAAQGWQADPIGQWSSVRMTFSRSEPKRYRYVYDMQAFPKKDYKSTYKQFGWEFVGQMASAFIWRKEYAQERPESFSDAESLEKRNKRVIGAASVSFFMFLVIALALPVLFALFYARLDAEDILQFIIGFVVSGAMSAYMGYVIHKMAANRRR